ncbi:hypothetical protein PybrP1_008889 [[Pythium] brassicae (nom. inval.)]|nr:hypothetical protein PybrP1_008889 [[Pythium] brassicae (nom. inval.)]
MARTWRAAVLALLATTVAAGLRECNINELRTFINSPAARECARDSKTISSFELLRAPPSDERMLEICRSAACRKLFDAEDGGAAPIGDCIVPTGERIRLYADLVGQVRARCASIKDAYVLVDCAVVGTSGTSSEFWYFPDSANASAAPANAKRWVVDASAAAKWEGDEVAVSSNGIDLFAYIEDTGRGERVGDFAGILEAGRRGATTAFECRRADDRKFPESGGKSCERRYICLSE